MTAVSSMEVCTDGCRCSMPGEGATSGREFRFPRALGPYHSPANACSSVSLSVIRLSSCSLISLARLGFIWSVARYMDAWALFSGWAVSITTNACRSWFLMLLTAPEVKMAKPSSLRVPPAVVLPSMVCATLSTSCLVACSLRCTDRPLWVRSLSWIAEGWILPSVMWSGSIMILRSVSWPCTGPGDSAGLALVDSSRCGVCRCILVSSPFLHRFFTLRGSPSGRLVLAPWQERRPRGISGPARPGRNKSRFLCRRSPGLCILVHRSKRS